MLKCIWNDCYSEVSVKPGSRMKLAIDLVLKLYNNISEEILNKAHENWKDLHQVKEGLVKASFE
ncbi:3-isopropylmalate dehydratase large subunit [Sesbania bispinosa]|nr:3-isopropylmalate dehydratase large subunit [Sesbania bispinosa]KAJ1402482.1 3-isopropylmalate dehydratase large subunit [Sesbania bispinosa]